MALETIDTFNVGKTTAKLINASPTSQAKIFNGSGGKLFYKTSSDVDTEDTEVAVGSSATVEQVVWIISESTSKVLVEHVSGTTSQDSTVVDDLTVGDKAYVKGELEVDGELNHDGSKVGFNGAAPVAKASALTAVSAEAIDSSYGAPEEAVLKSLKARSEEMGTILKNLGLVA
jgi:hypothetical protein